MREGRTISEYRAGENRCDRSKKETGGLQRRWPHPILPWQLYHLFELIGAGCQVQPGFNTDGAS